MTQKDLFGEVVEENSKPSKLETFLKKYDEESFSGRLNRLHLLNDIWPNEFSAAGDMEFIYTLEEIKMCFIDGQFIAAIILTQSAIEKIIDSFFCRKGLGNEAKKGLSNMIKHARSTQIIHPAVLEMVDKLRLIRNPMIHSKEGIYEHGLSLRAFQNKSHPYVQLEKDATEGIRIMAHIAFHGL